MVNEVPDNHAIAADATVIVGNLILKDIIADALLMGTPPPAKKDETRMQPARDGAHYRPRRHQIFDDPDGTVHEDDVLYPMM